MRAEKDITHELTMTLYILFFVAGLITIIAIILGLSPSFDVPWNF